MIVHKEKSLLNGISSCFGVLLEQDNSLWWDVEYKTHMGNIKNQQAAADVISSA